MSTALQDLLKILIPTPASTDQRPSVFTGRPSGESHVRAFGGMIVAQALAAAVQTVPDDRTVHSLHGYFLRPMNPNEPCLQIVDHLRDGRSMSLRRTDSRQSPASPGSAGAGSDGKITFTLTASFHRAEAGIEHSAAAPDAPRPESLLTFAERFANRSSPEDMGRWFGRMRAFDIRHVGPSPFDEDRERYLPRQLAWFRTNSPIERNAASWVHPVILAYASDLMILDPILLTHGMRWTDATILGASLDHAIWFHRPFRCDDWLLFEHQSDTAAAARGLAHARVWTADGELVATIAQEALLRPAEK